MNKWRHSRLTVVLVLAGAVLLLLLSLRAAWTGGEGNWGLPATLILLAALATYHFRYEHGQASSKEVSLVATLAALAGLGRVPFAAIPGVQPTTVMVIVSGYVFGTRAGFMVGSTAALASNFFLGQGPWTPWQMLAWGLAGATGGLLGRLRPQPGRWGLALFSGAWGYLFGWIMNLYFWITFVYPLNWRTLLATGVASFWMDSLHALSNVAFSLLAGEGAVKVLGRFRCRLEATYLPAISLNEEEIR